MTDSRIVRIAPLEIHAKFVESNVIQLFEPQLLWVKPTDLNVDHKYQRELSSKSTRLIRKIVKEWSWSAYKPPIVSRYPDGELYVIDGQHTSIAAATHPLIDKIPVFLVEKDMTPEERADSFVRHNTDRTAISQLELYKAQLEAGDDDATSLHMAQTRSGINFVYGISGAGAYDYKVGDCMCLATCMGVVRRRGPLVMRQIFDVCVAAKLAPIQAHYIQALEVIMFNEDVSKKDTVADKDVLALVIRDYPYARLASDVEYKSKSTGTPRKLIAAELLLSRYKEILG